MKAEILQVSPGVQTKEQNQSMAKAPCAFRVPPPTAHRPLISMLRQSVQGTCEISASETPPLKTQAPPKTTLRSGGGGQIAKYHLCWTSSANLRNICRHLLETAVKFVNFMSGFCLDAQARPGKLRRQSTDHQPSVTHVEVQVDGS